MLPDCVDRINISKFRCRNSKIPVVILGYKIKDKPKIPYEDRICSSCSLNTVGDEFHYKLQCPAFQVQRQKYLTNHYLIDPDRKKLSELFQNTNFNTLRKTAKLIAEINMFLKQTPTTSPS